MLLCIRKAAMLLGKTTSYKLLKHLFRQLIIKLYKIFYVCKVVTPQGRLTQGTLFAFKYGEVADPDI